MHMDDIKLFIKTKKKMETLIHTVRMYILDLEIEFGIENCATTVMKSGKRHLTDGMELLNKEDEWRPAKLQHYKIGYNTEESSRDLKKRVVT